MTNERLVENFESFNVKSEISTTAAPEPESFIPSTYYDSENFISKNDHYVLSYDFGYELNDILYPTKSASTVESQIDSTPQNQVEKDDRLYALGIFLTFFEVLFLGTFS